MKKSILVITMLLAIISLVYAQEKYLGRLSVNRNIRDSVSNPYGRYGSRYSPDSIINPNARYGSPYSTTSITNPYARRAPKVYARDGTYLGKLSSDPNDPESISNPNGIYGSRYSPLSINNPNGRYGNRYSPLSPNNPDSRDAPFIIGE
jgi:hypothetical protein